jgi:FtsZ-binding cell division protein ZapB
MFPYKMHIHAGPAYTRCGNESLSSMADEPRAGKAQQVEKHTILPCVDAVLQMEIAALHIENNTLGKELADTQATTKTEHEEMKTLTKSLMASNIGAKAGPTAGRSLGSGPA